MKSFYLKATEDTPEIYLNPQKGTFEFSGCSIPENVYSFYEPVIHWLNEYIKSPNQNNQFVFKIKMISSSSTKIFYEILEIINSLNQLENICAKVLWYYTIYDDEIREMGIEYKNELNLPFELILVDK